MIELAMECRWEISSVFHLRTKHIDSRNHFISDEILNNKIKLKYIQTNKVTTDVMTKGIDKLKHEICRCELELVLLKNYM